MLNHQPALDPIFHALADGTRRQIVARLSLGAATVMDIATPLPVSLPAVMQHLKVLENAGLVTSHKAGRTRTCHLDPAALGRAEAWISDRRACWSQALDRLESFLAADDGVSEASSEPQITKDKT